MKYIFIIVSIISSLACNKSGGGSGGGGNTPAPSTTPYNTFSITTAADLPTCEGEIVGRLYYIESTSLFQVCKTTGWTNINVKGADGTNGTNGTSGLTVTSNKIISSDSTDYCNQYTGENCNFKGGQIITYSDGSFILTYYFRYFYSNNEVDSDDIQRTLFYPVGVTSATPQLYWSVGRAIGFRSVYIQYTVSPESVKIYYDTDNSGTVNTGDELLYTATLTSI